MLKDFLAGLQRWVDGPGQERRRAPRSREPSLVVYYWDGATPEGRRLRDISASGAYIITAERWFVGTVVRLILQEYKAPERGDELRPSRSTTLLCRVVRHGEDGVAVQFMFNSEQEREALGAFLAAIPKTRNERGEAHVEAKAEGPRGQALIEFALVLPLLFLLVVNTVNFGGFLFAWITVANAARAGAQYMVRGSSAVGTPRLPTPAQITALVTSDISSLINRASLAVRVCTNNNGVVTCSGTGTGMPALDPEPASFVLGSVDVSYTYRPFVPLWEFQNLGIHATLPASTVHRQVSMRMLL